jgi:hypothetical protein
LTCEFVEVFAKLFWRGRFEAKNQIFGWRRVKGWGVGTHSRLDGILWGGGIEFPGYEGWDDEVLCEFEAAGFAGAGYGVCGGSDGANDHNDDDGGSCYDGGSCVRGSGRSDGSDGGACDDDDGDAGSGDAIGCSDAGRSGCADDGDGCA